MITQLKLMKATSGPLAGYTVAPVIWTLLALYKAACYAAGVRYGWGSKDPNPGSGIIGFPRIDCSGFFRTLMLYVTGGLHGAMAGLPDGSYMQGDWLAAKGFKPTTREALLLKDGHLRVAIHHPDHLDETGHIWLCVNGHTIESYGGHGPGERDPECRLHGGHTLGDLVSAAYVLC